MLQTILAAIEAIPLIAKAIGELAALATKIAKDIEDHRAIVEFEAARRLSRETGNTSQLEHMLGRPIVSDKR